MGADTNKLLCGVRGGCLIALAKDFGGFWPNFSVRDDGGGLGGNLVWPNGYMETWSRG